MPVLIKATNDTGKRFINLKLYCWNSTEFWGACLHFSKKMSTFILSLLPRLPKIPG